MNCERPSVTQCTSNLHERSCVTVTVPSTVSRAQLVIDRVTTSTTRSATTKAPRTRTIHPVHRVKRS